MLSVKSPTPVKYMNKEQAFEVELGLIILIEHKRTFMLEIEVEIKFRFMCM